MYLPAASATLLSSDTSPWWISVVVAGIPAIAAVSAAVIAALFARSARRSYAQATRAKELEDRISERKFDVYKPMIDLLSGILDPSKSKQIANDPRTSKQLRDFSTWITIFGSDQAVDTFHNFVQSAFASAPKPIPICLFADFMLAARRDMGYPDTEATRAQVLGMRINDLYSDQDFRDIGTKPFEELCRESNWTPPWWSVQ